MLRPFKKTGFGNYRRRSSPLLLCPLWIVPIFALSLTLFCCMLPQKEIQFKQVQDQMYQEAKKEHLELMKRRMMGNYHVRCEAGEKRERLPQTLTYCYYYYEPVPESEEDLLLMRLLDEQYT